MPADGHRVRALGVAIEIVPAGEWRVAIGRAAIGFGDVESDLACSQRIEDRLCEVGEAQSSLNVADSHAEPTGTIFLGGALLDDGAVATAFVRGRHRFAHEVLGHADFYGERRRFVLAHPRNDRWLFGDPAPPDGLPDPPP